MTLNGLWFTLNLMKALLKSYNEKSGEGYFLEVDIQYLKSLYNLHNDLPFSPEEMKTEKGRKACS